MLALLACVLGASIICVDILVRQFPGKRDFRIQDSDTFLSVSLSLSFGVMVSPYATKSHPVTFDEQRTDCVLPAILSVIQHAPLLQNIPHRRRLLPQSSLLDPNRMFPRRCRRDSSPIALAAPVHAHACRGL